MDPTVGVLQLAGTEALMDSYLSQLHEFQMMRRKETGERAFLTFLHVVSTSDRFLRIPETLIGGLGLKKPTLFYATPAGVKAVPASPQHLSDFVGLCSHHSGLSSLHPPLCVTWQNGLTAVSDTLAITSAWHKAIASKKDIILQRFVASSGTHQKTFYVTWRPTGSLLLSSTSKIALLAVRQKDLAAQNAVEEVFLPRKERTVPEMGGIEGLQGVVTGLAEMFVKRFKGEHYSELEELVVQCIQDRSQQWVVLKVRSFQLGRKMKALGQLKLQTESFGQIRINLKPNARRSSAKAKSVQFGLSPAIVDVKRLIGLPVSAYEVREALKNLHRSRTRDIRTAPTNAKRRNFPTQPKSLQESESVASIEHFQSKKTDDMPPIFQFPTPKTPVEADGLENMPEEKRFRAIREHIVRQNNSLFMRIHFQEELPEKRMLQDLFTSSMDRAVGDLETLRSRARHLRTRSQGK